MGIRVTEMNTNDEIIIRTQCSDYRFRLTNPVRCQGILTGGRFGMEELDAILAGTIPLVPTEPSLTNQLKEGGRAVFLVGVNFIKCVTTSVIEEVRLFPRQNSFERADSSALWPKR